MTGAAEQHLAAALTRFFDTLLFLRDDITNPARHQNARRAWTDVSKALTTVAAPPTRLRPPPPPARTPKTVRFAGHAYTGPTTPGTAPATCACGAHSGPLPSTYQRRQWHQQHRLELATHQPAPAIPHPRSPS